MNYKWYWGVLQAFGVYADIGGNPSGEGILDRGTGILGAPIGGLAKKYVLKKK